MAKQRQIKLPAGSQKELEFLAEEFVSDSERAAAVVAQAAIESWVRTALYCSMGRQFDRALIAKDLIGDEDTPGILSFSYQIKLAYCLELVSKDDLRDLALLARIRNKFAHSFLHRSFDKDPIKSMCMELGCADECTTSDGVALTMRERYLISGVVLVRRLKEKMLTLLDMTEAEFQAANQPVPEKPTRRKKRQ